MSMSKLESLPNEILLDLLENYANGVDVFVAFGNRLNGLFDALVDQCRPIHFDFRSIRKHDFELCLRRLPNYCDRIQSVTLSEDDTPSQIHAFLSIFPTFDRFSRLRQLHLIIDGNTVGTQSLIKALRSLFKTNLHRLSIEGKRLSSLFWWNHIIQGLLVWPSLRRLSLAIDLNVYHHNFSQLTPFNIQHLTIAGNSCTWNMLKAIFKCGRRLYYLNARVIHQPSNDYDSSRDKPFDIQPLTKLQTLSLSFIDDYDQITLDVLVGYLHKMPRLRYLEIIDSRARFADGNAWHGCIQTGLLFLNCFTLTVNSFFLAENDSNHALSSFRTLFWLERENFNVYVIAPDGFDDDIIAFNSKHNRMNPSKGKQRFQPLLTMVPQRCENVDNPLVKNLNTLCISSNSSLLLTKYHFSNIKRLTLSDLQPPVFRWIITHINLLGLIELRISSMRTTTDKIHSLLTQTKNLSSLMIHFSQVFSEYSTSIPVHDSVKRLDISLTEHPFQAQDILLLSRHFPSVEHLKINPTTLDNVPLLNTYLPKLHSLTFKLVHPRCSTLIQQWNFRSLNQSQLPLDWANGWITLWIDQATFQTRYWSSFLQTDHQLNHERLSKSHESKCVCS